MLTNSWIWFEEMIETAIFRILYYYYSLWFVQCQFTDAYHCTKIIYVIIRDLQISCNKWNTIYVYKYFVNKPDLNNILICILYAPNIFHYMSVVRWDHCIHLVTLNILQTSCKQSFWQNCLKDAICFTTPLTIFSPCCPLRLNAAGSKWEMYD